MEGFYRCAGPNCGLLKSATNRWWLMWTSFEMGRAILHLCPWDEAIANKEGTLHVCGELCAQRLQSQFMGNLLENELKKSTA